MYTRYANNKTVPEMNAIRAHHHHSTQRSNTHVHTYAEHFGETMAWVNTIFLYPFNSLNLVFRCRFSLNLSLNDKLIMLKVSWKCFSSPKKKRKEKWETNRPPNKCCRHHRTVRLLCCPYSAVCGRSWFSLFKWCFIFCSIHKGPIVMCVSHSLSCVGVCVSEYILCTYISRKQPLSN